MTLIFAAKDTASGAVRSLAGNLGGLKGGLLGIGGAARGVVGAFGKLGGGIASLGKIALGATLAGGGLKLIGDALGGMVQSAADDAASETKLGKALQNNVPNWQRYSKAISDRVTAGQKLAFSDDQMRDSLGALATRTKDVKSAMDLQAIAMDLARAKGIDLTTAANIVGKVYSGNVGILSRYGIAVDKGASATDALAAIQKSTTGQAAAYGASQKGAAETAQIAFGELQESIGYALIPVMSSLATFLNDTLIPAFSSLWTDTIQPAINTLLPGLQNAWNTVVLPALSGVWTFITTSLAPALKDLWDNVIKPAVDVLLPSLKTAWETVVLPALNGVWSFISTTLIPLLRTLWDTVIKPAVDELLPGLRDAWNLVVLPALSAVWDFTANTLVPALVDLWNNVIKPAIDVVLPALRDAWNTIVMPALKTVKDFVADTLVPALQHLWNDVIQPAIDVAMPALRDAWNVVVLPALKAVKDFLDQFLLPIFRELFDKVLQPFVDLLGPAVKTIFDGIGTVIGTLQGIIDTVIGPLRDLLGVVQDIVQGFLDMIGLSKQAPKPGEFNGPTISVGGTPPKLHPGNRQYGGFVARGEVYRVGEKHEELLVPDVTGRVLPSVQPSMINVGGITVHVTGGGVSGEQIADETIRALQRKLRQQRLSLA